MVLPRDCHQPPGPQKGSRSKRLRWLNLLLIMMGHGGPLQAQEARPYELAFSTYLGGSGWEHARDICVDSAGNIYVVGGTASANFPTTSGAYSTVYNAGVTTGQGVGAFGPCDAFVSKFNASGQLLWSTYLGGPAYDRAYAVEVDASGYVYISGRAGPGLPVTAGAMQTKFAGTTTGTSNYGSQNGFVAKFSPDGSQLIWCTYLGTGELVRDIDIDNDGDVYAVLTQAADSSNTLPAAFTGVFDNAFRPVASPGSNTECGAVKIKGDGSQVLWATWLGGSGNDSTAACLRVNRSTECPVVLFYTTSNDVVTAGSGATKTLAGGADMFVAALNSTGSALLYATYLGGGGDDEMETHSLALDSTGNAYIAFATKSSNLPTTPGSVGTSLKGASDIGIAKFGTNGQRIASTYIGGSGGENPDGIYVDGQSRIVVVAESSSTNFPITPATAFQSANGGSWDGVLFVLSSDLKTIEYGTYLGGNLYDNGRSCFLGEDGAMYLAGGTLSPNWPLRRAFQTTFRGGSNPFGPGSGDCIVAKFCRTTDSDGDGETDINEFIAGTNSSDPQDFFEMGDLSVAESGSLSAVNGLKGRYYTLEGTSNYLSWSEIIRTPTLSSSQNLLLNDTNRIAPSLFYRVRVDFP
jgi:hypothetical protein